MPTDSQVDGEEILLQALKNMVEERYNPMYSIPMPQRRGGTGYSFYGYGSPRVSRSLYSRPRRYGAGIRCKSKSTGCLILK